MPVVQIDWIEGRDDEKKNKLFEGITKVFEEVGVKKETLHIIIRDIPKNNWARGGVPFSKDGHKI